MVCEKVFLGWDAPVLPAAARWLMERFGEGMGEVVVVVPARRAGRRLEELVAEGMAGTAWEPPRFVTVGEVAGLLYEVPEAAAVADGLTAQVARVGALRGALAADRAALEAVVPRPPAADDVGAWWGLAESLGALADELAGGGLTVDAVSRVAMENGVDLGEVGERRWPALTALDAGYRKALGRPDRAAAELAALAGAWAATPAFPLVLVGVADLPGVTARLLAEREGVAALVAAPAEHAAGFDALGGLRAEYWHDRPVPLRDVRVVEDPEAQGAGVVEAVRGFQSRYPSAEAVTLGLGDAANGEPLRRTLEAAGAPGRVAGGWPAGWSGPAVLLAALGRYAQRRDFASLAQVVRHPDLAWLEENKMALVSLDGYRSETLAWRTTRELPGAVEGDPGKIEDPEVGGRARNAQRAGWLRDAVDGLLPRDAEARRPWNVRSTEVLELLHRVYGDRALNREREHRAVEALTALGRTLAEQVELDPAALPGGLPGVTFAQAIDLTLRRLAGVTLPEPGGAAAVELLGFLELALDDAPCVVLTDVNEKLLPEGRGADPFMPEPLRTALGLADARRRYARDVYLLNVVVRSRAEAVVFACRQDAQGDPRLPSRLVLADVDDDVKIARVRDFYREAEDDPVADEVAAEPRVEAAELPHVELVLPYPDGSLPLVREGKEEVYSATRLKLFLENPYRFYLQYVEGAETVDDRGDEMDGAVFGTLAHAVLEDFAKSAEAESPDPEAVFKSVSHLLDVHAARRFGAEPAAELRLQVAQLRRRLERFAVGQAREAREGWRIIDTEVTYVQPFTPGDGVPCTLLAKIDRIERHPQHGYRVVDYKTSEKGVTPEKAHHTPEKPTEGKPAVWKNVQLPLYRDVAMRELGVADLATAYWNLSADEKTSDGLRVSGWTADDYADAVGLIGFAIEQIRGRRFWNFENPPPRFDSAVARLAADKAPDRPRLIAAAARAAAERGDV